MAKSTTNEYRPSRGTAFVSRTFCPAARKEGACHQMFEGKICPKLGPIFHHNIPINILLEFWKWCDCRKCIIYIYIYNAILAGLHGGVTAGARVRVTHNATYPLNHANHSLLVSHIHRYVHMHVLYICIYGIYTCVIENSVIILYCYITSGKLT